MKNNSTFFNLLLFSFLFLTFFNTTVYTQSSGNHPWELIKEKGPLKVYTRKSTDSDIKEIRMTTNIKAPIEDFVRALSDADSYKEWVYKCESSRLVKKISDFELYYQVETDFPFPFSDRDLVVHTTQKFDGPDSFYSHSIARPNFQPEENGVVRIDLFESHWKVTSRDDGSIDIDYHSKVDPAGYIPQWIVNMGLTIGPIKTMESFAEFVEKKKFKN